MALAGGLILIGITALTCISITGRALLPMDIGLGPIQGIYDMTEMGMAAAIFAFLPWCQLQRQHATVELLSPVYPAVMNRVINLLVDMAMCLVATIGTWRMYLGMLDKQRYNETTLILQAPVWPGYLTGVLGLGAFALIAAFCVLRSTRALVLGQDDGGVDEQS